MFILKGFWGFGFWGFGLFYVVELEISWSSVLCFIMVASCVNCALNS